MGIKQNLLLMGTLMAVLVAAICGIGYYKAQDALTESTSNEIEALLNVEAASIDGWLIQKKQQAVSAANLGDRPARARLVQGGQGRGQGSLY